MSINRDIISELGSNYMVIRRFELQYKQGEEWHTLAEGTKIGYKLQLEFAPVTARYVRLYILEKSGNPTIRELQLFYAVE
jgi:alpha-L-fucosidase